MASEISLQHAGVAKDAFAGSDAVTMGPSADANAGTSEGISCCIHTDPHVNICVTALFLLLQEPFDVMAQAHDQMEAEERRDSERMARAAVLQAQAASRQRQSRSEPGSEVESFEPLPM